MFRDLGSNVGTERASEDFEPTGADTRGGAWRRCLDTSCVDTNASGKVGRGQDIGGGRGASGVQLLEDESAF